ncbi:MAG: 16S rRNA (guanine(527)-N(7))-methyltransferase RsmG [Clostridiales bacterium]|nr:16S rRNA (guanine(527)-N(7))-methyltransferase RsmG [Clostridiales bacterium]
MTDSLLEGAAVFGINLSALQIEQFSEYNRILEYRNSNTNLTAVVGEEEVIFRHFLDSLALFQVSGFKGSKIIDIGTGAGFPGVPLKIADNTIALTLLDSRKKRVEFLRDLCGHLGLQAELLCGRAEELSNRSEHRDNYDFAVSRALARLNVLCELCMPYVRVGGAFLAMKASGSSEELAEAENAVLLLGGKIENVYDYEVGKINRNIIVIKKLVPTPEGYPRRFARLQKQPL